MKKTVLMFVLAMNSLIMCGGPVMFVGDDRREPNGRQNQAQYVVFPGGVRVLMPSGNNNGEKKEETHITLCNGARVPIR